MKYKGDNPGVAKKYRISVVIALLSYDKFDKFILQVWQVYLFYNQKIIDPCGTYIQSQVNTGINIGIMYNWLT